MLVICGPTAVGKTALGLKLAKKFDGEILSADSKQVYKGMSIGTGKDLPENAVFRRKKFPSILNEKWQIGYYLVNGIKIWLLDIVEPSYRFNIADYLLCATLVIKDIWERKKLPIIVGGTGFYIKGVIDGIETLGLKPDWKFRQRLEGLSLRELRDKLNKINPLRLTAMNESDQNNPRRLARAIEIAVRIKKLKEERCKISRPAKIKFDSLLMIGLKSDLKNLYARIDERVDRRVEMGIEKEIKELRRRGYDFRNSALGTTIGYREWEPYFGNPQSFDISVCFPTGKMGELISHPGLKREMIQRWKFDEHGYARRQMVWFKKESRIKWFDIDKATSQVEIERLVDKWYNADESKNFSKTGSPK